MRYDRLLRRVIRPGQPGILGVFLFVSIGGNKNRITNFLPLLSECVADA